MLQTEPLRMLANKIAYADAEQFGTPDAMRIGRLHTYDDAWADSMIGFMESGGYRSPPPLCHFPHVFPYGGLLRSTFLPPSPARFVRRLSTRVEEVDKPALVLWGRQDKILDPSK